VRTSVIALAIAGVAVGVMSEVLVGSISEASESVGLSEFFIGVIVVAIVGNAAEHWVAVLVAFKGKMDLAVNIAIGSSAQVALFVAPVLVIVGALIGQDMTLVFTPLEVAAVAAAVGISALIALDGESNWLEGALLMLVYLILAVSFFELR
jgi:Ca2+:H+ antiporter